MNATDERPETESAELRHEIDSTRSAMANKLEALENRVIGTVQSAQETVHDSIQSAKDTVASVKRTFDIEHQVEQRPWAIVGGCFLAGVVVGYLIPNGAHRFSPPAEAGRNGFAPPTPQRQPEGPARASIFEPFQGEIDKAKGIAIGYVMGLVRDAIKESVPQFAPKINDLVNGLTTKLGGEPSEQRSA
jgi:ElaB/YqjD/DUF883 family membrane-anchored ribosome-binding protein